MGKESRGEMRAKDFKVRHCINFSVVFVQSRHNPWANQKQSYTDNITINAAHACKRRFDWSTKRFGASSKSLGSLTVEETIPALQNFDIY